MTYVAEPIPSDDIEDMLNTNWTEYNGSIPRPTFVQANDPAQTLRQEFNNNDLVIIRVDSITEEESPIGVWTSAHRETNVTLQLITKISRQRLYDMKQEIRRICHNQMHSMTNYQRVQYRLFTEEVDENVNIWTGLIQIQLINSAVVMST